MPHFTLAAFLPLVPKILNFQTIRSLFGSLLIPRIYIKLLKIHFQTVFVHYRDHLLHNHQSLERNLHNSFHHPLDYPNPARTLPIHMFSMSRLRYQKFPIRLQTHIRCLFCHLQVSLPPACLPLPVHLRHWY